MTRWRTRCEYGGQRHVPDTRGPGAAAAAVERLVTPARGYLRLTCGNRVCLDVPAPAPQLSKRNGCFTLRASYLYKLPVVIQPRSIN